MFGFRTPVKDATQKADYPPKEVEHKNMTERAGPLDDRNQTTSKVRRSVGEIEARRTSPKVKKPEQKQLPQEEKTKSRTTGAVKVTSSQRIVAEIKSGPSRNRLTSTDKEASLSPKTPKTKYKSRTAEAEACLLKAKLQIDKSRNLKLDIKCEVLEAVERLYALVKEAEEAKMQNVGESIEPNQTVNQTSLLAQMDEHTKHLKENTRRIEELREVMERQREQSEKMTYANVAANNFNKTPPNNRETLHSVVITSTDETETGEEVLDRVRKVAEAKEGWVAVEKVRKGKDRKVIMGFKTREDQGKMKEKLGREGNHLVVEEVKNKDPLLILRDVLSINTDEDVLKALNNQNRNIFHGLSDEEGRVEIKYRRKARNPHTGHVIISVSPTVWRRAVDAGTLHIDLQRVRVADQSPLVQCTRCLAYGHGRRVCKETADLCSHCGGPHLRMQCAEWLAGNPPTCRNCTNSRIGNSGHNAFSSECQVRKRWDILARSTVAYC